MKIKALLGKKREMSQIWRADGSIVPVTIVEAGPCLVTQVKAADGKDGYSAYQFAFDQRRAKVVAKPNRGHLDKTGQTGGKYFRVLREFRFVGAPEYAVGHELKAGVFAPDDIVDVTGTSKGKGFQGGIKRHKFNSGPRGHGTKNTREPGSTGMNTTPGRVFKGKRMPGHMGVDRVTVKNLRIEKVDEANNLLFIRGAVPGWNGGDVMIRLAAERASKGR